MRILFFLILFTNQASTLTLANKCSFIFGETHPRLEKAVERLSELSPELIKEFQSLPKNEQNLLALYQLLKEEGWRITPNGYVPWKDKPTIDPKTIESIKENYKKTFRTEDLDIESLYMFYANALQAQYITVAQFIKLEFVESILPHNASKELKSFADQVVDQAMFPSLGRKETDPKSAQSFFEKELESYVDWPVFINLAQRYLKEAKEDSDPLEWIKQQPESEKLSMSEKNIFAKGFGERENKKQFCCLSTPGCLFCPNNRSFLRPKED